MFKALRFNAYPIVRIRDDMGWLLERKSLHMSALKVGIIGYISNPQQYSEW